ncbi:MAG: hypothetical protein SFU91_14035 [Chloroherpetonaceae bacterium]|nr:hypothetical protein [Chloroherpetonaceae bacterium]
MAIPTVPTAYSDEAFASLQKRVNDLASSLSFTSTLSSVEIKRLKKVGDSSIDYLNDCQSAVAQFPNVMPADFDKASFENAVQLFSQAESLLLQIEQVHKTINDLRLVAANKARAEADTIYNQFKLAVKKNASLKPMVTEMGARFKKQGMRKSDSK